MFRPRKKVLITLLILGAFPVSFMLYILAVQDDLPSSYVEKLAISSVEVKLIERVHEIEEQNVALRKQLSQNQNQLLRLQMTLAATNDSGTLSRIKCVNAEPDVPKCEVIHVAIVCAGHNATRDVVTLIKSVLFYRRNPLHIHFLSDSVAELILQKLFQTWNVAECETIFKTISQPVN